MKTSHTGYSLRHFAAAALGSLLVLAATTAPAQTKSSPVNILLSGPGGEPSTLVYTPEGGWRLHEGWASTDTPAEGAMKAAVAREPASTEGPMSERPLTVFVDGPTGFTYIYLFDKGWKFVGRVAEEKR
jgi:hypothetical protein